MKRKYYNPSFVISLLSFVYVLFNQFTLAVELSSTSNSSLPTYTIGILFPNASEVRNHDPALNNMIVTSELSIELALQHIRSLNYLPDVHLNFTRYNSSQFHGGKTSWTTTQMIEDGVNAVIGDMVSNTTQISAGISGLFQIPQCSCGASSLELSNKANYPYFFRTMGNVVAYGGALMEWIRQMEWSMFALVYTDDGVGQQILTSMLTKSHQYGITPMSQIPLYDLGEDDIAKSLETLIASGTRIVIVADSNPANQILILQAARSMGMLSEGWVWMLTNDLSEALSESIDTQDLVEFDGLMFISGLWNLTDLPAYNDLYSVWQQQPIPADFVDPSQWYTLGLSYNGPSAYACAEVLALGLNKALNEYPGGRQKGLLDLSANRFNSTPMIPSFYNMNYTGPAGRMVFTDAGDQQTGHFGLQYMRNGSTVTYAEVLDGVYKSVSDHPILYLGNTHHRPADMAKRSSLNPKSSEVAGLAIYAIACTGMILCFLTMILILCYRHLKMVLVSSPIFLCLQLTGIFAAYVSVILYVNNVTVAKCIARQLTLVVGFILVIGSIIAKNYRIYRIFQNVYTLQASKLQSIYLLRIIIIFGVIASLPLVIWFAIYPVEPTSHMVTLNTYCTLCSYPTSNKSVDWIHLNIAELVSAIVCFILIAVASLLAWKTRKVNSKWSESQQIGYVSYNTGLAAIVAAPAFFLSIDLYQIAIYLKLAAILFSATFTFFVLFLTKLIFICKYMTTQRWFRIWQIYPHQHHKHDMNENDDRLGSCTQLAGVHGFETQSDPNAHNALVAKNLLDYTVKAHEGILPVKKRARFHFMSIWQLKHVVVIPSKQMFILMTTMGNKAEYHQYTTCQAMSRTNSDRFIFCVWTDKNLQLYFQVHDEKALSRWVNRFNGDERSYDVIGLLGQRKNGNLPSISTLGASSGSPLNAFSTTRNTGTMASSDQFLDSFVPQRPVYHHETGHHLQNFGHSASSSANAPTETADFMDTYNFYSRRQDLQLKNDNNPLATFGVANDGHSY